MENKGLQIILSAAFAAFAVYIGALAVPIMVLIAMMVIDYASGMAAAWSNNELSSKVGAKGIVKKVGYMALIVVAMGVDYLIYSGIAAVKNELISILENLDRLGVPIPDFLTKIIKRLKVSVDEKEKK